MTLRFCTLLLLSNSLTAWFSSSDPVIQIQKERAKDDLELSSEKPTTSLKISGDNDVDETII